MKKVGGGEPGSTCVETTCWGRQSFWKEEKAGWKEQSYKKKKNPVDSTRKKGDQGDPIPLGRKGGVSGNK